jgi:uncharacterized membrane protein
MMSFLLPRGVVVHLPPPFILLMALMTRSYHLGRLGFWYDEGASAYLAEAVRANVWIFDLHPPLYIALLAVWGFVSNGDLWLRSLSVVFGVATVGVVSAIGQALFTRATGLWAAALLSVTYFHVKYSQEARMYALMGLLFATAFWGLVIAVQHQRRAGWTIYIVAASLLMYSHAIAVVYVIALALVFPLLAPRLDGWRTWRPWAIANAAIGVLFVPWIAFIAQRVPEVRSRLWIPPGDVEPPFFSTLQLLTVSTIPPLSSMLRSRLGAVVPAALGRWVWFVPILAVTLWLVTRMARLDARATRILLLTYAVPIALLSAASVAVGPVLIPRVLLPAVVPVVVLLGSGVEYLSSRRVLNHVVMGGLVGLLLLATLSFHKWGVKEEWREASHFLGQHVGRGELLLLDIDGRWVPPYLLERYDTRRRLTGNPMLMISPLLSECPGDVGVCLDRAVEPYRLSGVVWIVHSHTEFMPRRGDVERWLHRRFEPLGTSEFEGIQVEHARIKSE